jgi:hypothetical protein
MVSGCDITHQFPTSMWSACARAQDRLREDEVGGTDA